MEYSKPLIRLSSLFPLGLLCGCGAPVFGVYEEVVKDPPAGGIYSVTFYVTLAALVVALAGHDLFKKKAFGAAIKWRVVSGLCALVFSYTFLGTWMYIAWDWVHGWGLLGAIVLVLTSLAAGLLPGPGFFRPTWGRRADTLRLWTTSRPRKNASPT